MDSGLVLLLLFAAIAAWLLNRIAKMLRIPVSPKAYMMLTTAVILGVLLLYANAQA